MGIAWVVACLGGLGAGAYGVARFGLSQPSGWPRGLATAVLAWAWLTVGLQVMGSVGWLARGPIAVWCGALLAVGLACRALGDRSRPVPRDEPGPWSWPAIVSMAMAGWACVAVGTPSLLRAVKVVSDGPIYHLYFAAKWWRTGRLDWVPTPFGESAAAYFPGGGDLWFSCLMTLWGGDRLAKVGQAPFLLMAAGTAYALARRAGATRNGSAIAASLFATIGPLLMFNFEANVDTMFIAGYLASVYFLARSALGDDGLPACFLGGLAAGCSLGTKPTALAFVPPILLIGALLALRKQAGKRRWLAPGLVLVSAIVPCGSWYGRNFWFFGNPLYPLHIEMFGHVIWPGWYASEAMRRSWSYYLDVRDWRSAVDLLLAVPDPRLLPFWLAAVFGAWRIGRRGRPGDRLARALAALAVLNVAIYWFAIPYRTQQRFMLQAFGLAAAPLALLLDRNRWLAGLAAVVLGLHMVTPQTWPIVGRNQPIPWDLSRVVPNDVPGPIALPQSGPEWAAIRQSPMQLVPIVGLILVGLLSVMAVAFWCRADSARRPFVRRLSGGLFASLAVGITAAMAYPWGLDDRHRAFPNFDFLPGWIALDSLAGPSGSRIAYAGTNLPYYLMGVGLRNDVVYVNTDDHPDWRMHDYHRRAIEQGKSPWPTPRPGWDREVRDESAWLANVRAAGIQFLVVTRADPREGPYDVHDPERFPIERTWADAHPEIFRLVHGQRDPIFRIYQVVTPQLHKN